MTSTGEKPTEPVEKLAFEDKVTLCLEDLRIARFFKQRVPRPPVVRQLVEGRAFKEALSIPAYKPYYNLRHDLLQKRALYNEAIFTGAINRRTLSVLICLSVAGIALLGILSHEHFVTFAVTLGMLAPSTAGAALLNHSTKNTWHRFRRRIIGLQLIIIAFAVLIIPPLTLSYQWDPFSIIFPLIGVISGWLLAEGSTLPEILQLTRGLWTALYTTTYLTREEARLQSKWLDECVESVIIPRAKQAINRLLGANHYKILVEPDTDGLRRSQDPAFTVQTRSEERIAGILSQIDGGSIAIAGPRGAGKSTLLRKFTSQGPPTPPGISLYIPAPAEYDSREFIAAVFQRLCDEYLRTRGYPLPRDIDSDKPLPSLKLIIRKVMGILWFSVRMAAALAIIGWLLWPFVKENLPHAEASFLDTFHSWQNATFGQLDTWWSKRRLVSTVILALLALILMPKQYHWRRYIHRRKEPALIKKARNHLSRLQVDKSITLGRSLSIPNVKALGLGVSHQRVVKYMPWTLPELVSHAREFMLDAAKDFPKAEHAIIVGIDEIDRIGTIQQAEQFIGEIKTIFGIEKCFFLVAVAEDVGSIFSQRASGRSILDNAFDDVVVVEPLSLEEAQGLVETRVVGFTWPFSYLVHALSGGLPRELIRVTRRLVEINQKMQRGSHYPELEELSYGLVREQLLLEIRATRNQMSGLRLNIPWTAMFDPLRSVSKSLSMEPIISKHDAYSLAKELSSIIWSLLSSSDVKSVLQEDEESARRILDRLHAFIDFSLTIIDAFSDENFDSRWVRGVPLPGSKESYEQLAFARFELSFSPDSCRSMLEHLKVSLGLYPTVR